MQSRFHSAVETIVSTAVGFILSLIILWLLTSHYGWESSTPRNVLVTGIFTIASLLRGYFVRRFFNWLHHRPARRAEEPQQNYAAMVAQQKALSAKCYVCDSEVLVNGQVQHYRDCPLRARNDEPVFIKTTLKGSNQVKPYPTGE